MTERAAPGPPLLRTAAALVLFGVAFGTRSLALAADPVVPADKPPLAARIIAAEGGPGDNPLSSASGYGQFLRDTWLDIFRRAYPRVAPILTGQQILALRDVKPLAEDLTNRFAQENAASLRQLGLPASDATLSLAHAVGAGGAINILTSTPGRSVRDLLSAEAVAANPGFGDMTAGQLRQWAATRVSAMAADPANQPQPASRRDGVAAFRREAPATIAPADDFRINGREQASQILAANRVAIERLENFVGIAPGAGGPTPLAGSTQEVKKLVFVVIREVAIRPAYREFAQIARSDHAGKASLSVLRDVAVALVDKMQRENDLLLSIATHRRARAAEVRGATPSAGLAQPQREATR